MRNYKLQITNYKLGAVVGRVGNAFMRSAGRMNPSPTGIVIRNYKLQITNWGRWEQLCALRGVGDVGRGFTPAVAARGLAALRDVTGELPLRGVTRCVALAGYPLTGM